MIKILPLLIVLAFSSATLSAQAEGDLMPRAGTLAYMVSDNPDVVYRLFGKDNKGAWKLKSWAKSMIDNKIEDSASEEAEKMDAIHQYIFGSYEQLSKVELGLIDITLDGPKYLLVMHTKTPDAIDKDPDFLKEFKEGSDTHRDITYIKYRAETREGEQTLGMDRFYVAQTKIGLLVSNFESTIRDAIDKLVDKSTDESLSGRKEFKEWVANRSKHDFAVFVVGREIQKMIERLMPSEEQAGADFEGVYEDLDSWLNMREYRYVVFYGDFDESARGITVSAEFRTRRPTKLMEKLAIEAAEFKLLKYVPRDAVIRGGFQLGDAKATFESLRAFANDMSESVAKIASGRGPTTEPGEKKDWEDEKGEGKDAEKKESNPPSKEDDWLPKSFKLPIEDILKGQDMGEGEEALPEGDEGSELSEVERALEKFDEMLSEYGTSRDGILNTLGSEVIVFLTTNSERAMAGSNDAFGNIMSTGTLGILIGIKDVAALKTILANAREKDAEGAFKGFAEVGYQGFMFNVSEERPYGYCITKDALLVCVPMGVEDENAAPAVIAGLQAMAEASTKTDSVSDGFVSNCSKFLEVDLGAIFKLGAEVEKASTQALDRNVRPEFSKNPFAEVTDLMLSFRLKEYKDGAEVAFQVSGLPDFGKLLDMTIGGNQGDDRYAQRNAYEYGESNLNTVMDALNEHVNAGGGELDLDQLVKDGKLRAGALQSPFDRQWTGDVAKLQSTTLSQVRRDKDGNLDEWVDEEAAQMIEANEKAGWRSFKLNEGDLVSWIKDYKAGFIVAYQEKPDSMDGHLVLYANGMTGWLHQGVFAKAIELNKKGEPVPAKDAWDEWEKSGSDKDGPYPDDDKKPDDGDYPEKK